MCVVSPEMSPPSAGLIRPVALCTGMLPYTKGDHPGYVHFSHDHHPPPPILHRIAMRHAEHTERILITKAVLGSCKLWNFLACVYLGDPIFKFLLRIFAPRIFLMQFDALISNVLSVFRNSGENVT